MRQLVSVVQETGVAWFLTDEAGEAATQIAQTINPGWGVGDVVEVGVQLTDMLRLNGKHRPKPPPAVETPPAPALPEPAPSARRYGKRRGPNMEWGFTRGAVLTTVQSLGSCLVEDVVQAFGHPVTVQSKGACNQALMALYREDLVTRETLLAHSPDNPSNWARTRYTAVPPD